MNLKSIRALCVGASLSVLTACASTQPAQDQTVFDPIEPVNRVVHNLNGAVDFLILYPAAMWYGDIAPQPVKNSVRSFANNLGEPINAVNALFQGDPDQAVASLQRFIVNSTIGLLGFNDVATEFGIPYRDEDFGQTLAHYGVGAGPYIVLPLFGPSNLRDTTGLVTDYLMNPFTYGADNSDKIAVGYYGGMVGGAIDSRYRNNENIEQLKQSSLDYYAALRSLYRQHRNSVIRNGGPVMNDDQNNAMNASFDFDDSDAPAGDK
ncbi:MULTISPECIES: VacJ family lipoprotein [unclassified Thalassospira]|jgi:phospholipid-binding lipoprotein MlaA|uniref:MlaA family lipoprotein n=1 Tax=unclassified Thalassospira TaxID=2648997 RepID=UPI000A1D719E|nr:VacJ family lipoprotein [Thalassospira sp. MCCC 1A01428]